jgi:hypothetical protein
VNVINDQQPVAQKKGTNKFAIVSFVLGILNIIVLSIFTILGRLQLNTDSWVAYLAPFIVLSVIALFFGIIAINQIYKNKNMKGSGIAIAGLVGASLVILPMLIYLLLLIAISLHLFVT